MEMIRFSNALKDDIFIFEVVHTIIELVTFTYRECSCMSVWRHSYILNVSSQRNNNEITVTGLLMFQ